MQMILFNHPFYICYIISKFNPNYIAVSCDYFETSNDEKILGVKNFQNNFLACGIMFRTSYLEIIGSYNKDKRIFEDEDLFFQNRKEKIYHLGGPYIITLSIKNSLTSK